MNTELRSRVLEVSIRIEDTLSTLLSHLFKIKKDASLTLGVKGTSLSFSSKVDLLKDLNRISADEQRDFRLFMEIRNKLIHNLPIDTMMKALISIDRGKIQQLLKGDHSMMELYRKCRTDEEKEEILILAFDHLAIRINRSFSSVMKSLINENNEQMELQKSKIARDLLNCLMKAVDKFSDVFDTAFVSNNPDDFGLAKNAIGALFEKEIETLIPDFILAENTTEVPALRS
jgi:hypothetical protein